MEVEFVVSGYTSKLQVLDVVVNKSVKGCIGKYDEISSFKIKLNDYYFSCQFLTESTITLRTLHTRLQ